MLSIEQRRARARLAASTARANRNGTDPDRDKFVTDARREYRFLSAAEYVRDLVDAAPPLTTEQRDRLAVLLRSGGDDAA